ncbi:MAG: hypothetical protein KatS3mg087_0642 [Patescibacteria group bacterium]|nr:MAG: hypothetical protein KatS3mg087_0642 [Patescibacteria group bacterium]
MIIFRLNALNIMNREQLMYVQMQLLLHHNVPRFIEHIKNRGGITEEEIKWLQREDEIDTPPTA